MENVDKGKLEKVSYKPPPPQKKHTTTQFKKMMGWVGEKRGFENPEKAILGTMWHKYPPPLPAPKKKHIPLEKWGVGENVEKGKTKGNGKTVLMLANV